MLFSFPRENLYWTEKRLEIKEWLYKQYPSLGELYEGAVNLLFNSDYNNIFPGVSRFVSHAVREIINNLPNYVLGRTSKPLQYVNYLDNILEKWENNLLPLEDKFNSSRKDELCLPYHIFRKIQKLLRKHKESRLKRKDIIVNFIIILAPENREFIDQLRPSFLKWIDLSNYFIKFVHDSQKTDREILTKEFLRHFEIFEDILHSLIGSFFATTEELDAILEEANTRSD